MRLLLLAIFAQLGFGCDCAPISVRSAKKYSEVVFRGTIVGFTNSNGDEANLAPVASKGWPIAVFRVTRVWKGNVGPTFEMPALSEAGCSGFWEKFLRTGADLLVYADLINGDYITSICSRTQLASESKDFAQLGLGHAPRKQK